MSARLPSTVSDHDRSQREQEAVALQSQVEVFGSAYGIFDGQAGASGGENISDPNPDTTARREAAEIIGRAKQPLPVTPHIQAIIDRLNQPITQATIDARLENYGKWARGVPATWAEAKEKIKTLMVEITENEKKLVALHPPKSKPSPYQTCDLDGRATLACIALIYPEHVIKEYNAAPSATGEFHDLWRDEIMLRLGGEDVEPKDPLYDLLRVARVTLTIPRQAAQVKAPRCVATAMMTCEEAFALGLELKQLEATGSFAEKKAFIEKSDQHAWAMLTSILKKGPRWGKNPEDLSLVDAIMDQRNKVFKPYENEFLIQKILNAQDEKANSPADKSTGDLEAKPSSTIDGAEAALKQRIRVEEVGEKTSIRMPQRW